MSYNFIMLFGTGGFNLFGNRLPDRQMNFDINLLPMNLSEGRNIGELSGLFLYTAPKKVESSRQADIFIVLFYVDNIQITESRMRNWANLLADTYYTARGSFTMGMASAIKKLAAYLAKENKGQIMPVIYMNTAVLRDRSIMIAHAGPVHTTIISSNKVQNFNDETCLPIQITHNELSFFTADVHSEDIILLCPKVPNDWTNAAIMEVTGDSPLNAIRFLLDRSGGNLQAAVIQLKSGKGQISFRSKTQITANVQEEKQSINKNESEKKRHSSDLINPFEYKTDMNNIPIDRPLIRQRKSMELFDDDTKTGNQQPDIFEKDKSSDDAEIKDNPEETSVSLTGDRELPGSENLPYDFSEENPDKKQETSEKSLMRKKVPGNQSQTNSDLSNKNQKKQNKSKRKFNAKRFVLILICGLLIPVFVVAVLFFIYSGRSKNQLHEEFLSLGVAAAQKAIDSKTFQEKESLWTESLSYSEQALSYGNSQAARDLRKQAMLNIDQINGGISTIYNYANQNKLPQGLNIVEISTAGQFTYALDSTSGSVLRFSASGNGLSLDNNFTCSPGIYKLMEKETDDEEKTENKDKTVKVNPLVGFFTLPSGNPHGFVLAGIDADANIIYCTGNKNNRAQELIRPNTRELSVSSVYFSNNSLYILDNQASVIWEYLFNNSEGFIYEPSNYYGSYTPFLSDIIDFAMFKEYSYFLRNNSTLLVCDYTSYRPDCQEYTDIQNEDKSVYVGFKNHHFKKILVNTSPDNSIYIMDEKLQSVLNLSVKLNYIRYIVPNRSIDEISQYSHATGFGITGQNRLLWSYQNDLYIANMP